MRVRFVVCLVAVFLVSIATGFVVAQSVLVGAAPQEKAVYVVVPGQPDAIVIRPSVAATARVCAEPPAGLLSCRPVSEFRAWVTRK
jgi:hypothetical protein